MSHHSHFGQLYPANTIVDGQRLLDLNLNGQQYRVIIGRNGLPIVQSHQSARSWVPSWEELISLAIAAGIDRNDEGANPCH